MSQHDMNDRDPHISELWREAAHGEPPAALDAHILAAARAAVQAPAPQRKRSNWWKLLVPLSTTAVLVLALSVALRVEKADRFNEAAAPAPASPAADMAKPAAAPPQEIRALAEARVPAAKQPSPAASAPARSAPAPASPAPTPFPMADKAVPSDNMTAGAPMAAEKQASAQAEAPMPESARQAKVSAARSAEPVPLIPPGETPAATVERIRRLLKDGRTGEARRTLAELRARQPEFVVPEDLRGLR